MNFIPNERVMIIPGEPSDFEVRQAALNAALTWRAGQGFLSDVFNDADRFERYLRGEPQDRT
jgi:hypothetical protein